MAEVRKRWIRVAPFRALRRPSRQRALLRVLSRTANSHPPGTCTAAAGPKVFTTSPQALRRPPSCIDLARLHLRCNVYVKTCLNICDRLSLCPQAE